MFGPKNRGNGTVERRFPARPPSGRSSRVDPKDAARNGTSTPTTRKLAVDDTKLRANLASCKYEAVRLCTSEHGYEEVGDEEEYWDLNWTDLSVSEHRVAKMHPFQRINHFPGMMEICRKASLSRHLKRMQQACPEGTYDFAPTTWEYPHELESFRRHCRGNPGGTYIVKPTAGAMGRGIYLIRKPEDIDHKHERDVVIQKYLANPFLVDGYKFDLRVYALVTCVDPLTVYVYDEGIARFATLKYEAPGRGNLREKTMHLTNYSVNKHSDTFEHADAEDEGTKRTLTALMRDLETRGHDVKKLRREISDVVVRTIAPIQPHLAHVYHSAVTNGPTRGAPGSGNERDQRAARWGVRGSYRGFIRRGRGCAPERAGDGDAHDSRCFEILGFDIILDDALRPTLLEVNHSPSFGIDSPLDRRIKTGMIGDVLAGLRLDAAEATRGSKLRKNANANDCTTAARLENLPPPRGPPRDRARCAVPFAAVQRRDGRRQRRRGGVRTRGNGAPISEAEAWAQRRSTGFGALGDAREAIRGGAREQTRSYRVRVRGRVRARRLRGRLSVWGVRRVSVRRSTRIRRGDFEFRVPTRRSVGRRGRCPRTRRFAWVDFSACILTRPDSGGGGGESRARHGGFAGDGEALITRNTGGGGVVLPTRRGCACASCDARNTREQLGYAIQHMRRVTVEGDDAPLDVRDDEFLSSFRSRLRRQKNFAVRVGGDAAGGDGPARTRTYTSLAARASLNRETPETPSRERTDETTG